MSIKVGYIERVKTSMYGMQGDVLFKPALALRLGVPTSAPTLRDAGFKEVEPVLAYGEVTGHSHRIHPEDQGRVRFFKKNDQAYLFVDDGGARLIHEEHGTVNFAPGWYEIGIQREQSLENIQDWYRTQD